MVDCNKCEKNKNCLIKEFEVQECADFKEVEKPTIKDSGHRREFATGATRDCAEGKGRFDLMPWAALMEVAKHTENGAKKYGEHNVDKGLPLSSFIDSSITHIAKYVEGWTDEPHLIAAAWNLLWAIQTEIKHPELKNVPWVDKENAKDELNI